MAGKVEICNMALSRLGYTRFISSLTEASQEANQLNLMYDFALSHTLSEFPWLFARKTVPLALVSNAEHPVWEYVYRYPVDCLRVVHLLSEDGGISDIGQDRVMIPGRHRVTFEVGADDVGRVILTNEPSAVLVYTALVDDPMNYPPSFVDVLAWRLAFESAMALTADPGLQERAEVGYRRSLGAAMEHSFNESEEGREPDSEFMRVRG